jgi:hypothetical protein
MVVDNASKDKSVLVALQILLLGCSNELQQVLQTCLNFFLVVYHKGQLWDPVFSQFRLSL